MHVMKILGLVNGGQTPFDGQYLAEYDPDREGTDPNGDPMLAHIVCTPDKRYAMHFDGFADFHATWAQVSTRWPVRPDGQPNRPLTAFSVSTERVEGDHDD